MPYNLLLHRDARESLGIDLTNQVVVIDEAHSEYDVMWTQQTLTNLFGFTRSHFILALVIYRHAPTGNSKSLLGTADSIHITVQEQISVQTCAPLEAPVSPSSHFEGLTLKLAAGELTRGDDCRWFTLKTGWKARGDQFSRDSELSPQEQGKSQPLTYPSSVYLLMNTASKEDHNLYSEGESEGKRFVGTDSTLEHRLTN